MSETAVAPAAPVQPSSAAPERAHAHGGAHPSAHGAPHGAGAAPAGGGAPVALPPLTLDGWYAHHQLLTVDRAALRAMDPAARAAAARETVAALAPVVAPDGAGWSALVVLAGSQHDAMVVHFRDSLDAVGAAQRAVLAAPLGALATQSTTFLSVTEAGMYNVAAQLAKAAAARGGAVGDAQWDVDVAERLAAERTNPHVEKRLYPQRPEAMPYVCFYPMSKRRAVGQNWYEQTLEERNRLMWAHGKTGRRYAGKVSQVVTGAIGFDVWEWGVTLFAADPLEFKRIVTEMRFDEVSAKYAEFGAFHVGRAVSAEEWVAAVFGG